MIKKAPAFAALLLALALAAPGQQPQNPVDWSTKPLQSERTQTYDALHYLIKIWVDLDQKSFGGETTVTVASLREGLKTVVLDAEEFKVASVRNDYGEPLTFSQSETELTVNLPAPAKLGEHVTFTVAYAGRDPKIGLRFMDATPDNPKIVFSDSFPVNVHHWFPCYDYPNDKVTNELVVTVKSGNKVGANGRLVGVTEDRAGGTVTWHWSQDFPHSTYLIFFAAAPYVVVKDAFGTLPVNYWVYPQDEAKARPTYGKTPKMIAFFNKTYGYDYPWQKYDQISVPSGGGAESTSATAMTHRIMVGAADEADFPAIGIVSHELAHQWWGDLITLRSWAHTWLNESFGTYSDYLYHRYEMGEDEGALNLANKLAAYLREAKTRYIRPIVSDRYEKPGDMFDSHTYPKGARVIHMLRSILGDEAFFKTISAFLHRYAFQPAETSDFIRTVKDATGRNLDWFFDQWLFKPGHPVFDIGAQWLPARKAVQMTVAQAQDYAPGLPGPRRRQDRDGRGRGHDDHLAQGETRVVRVPGRDQAAPRPVRRGQCPDQGSQLPPRSRRTPLQAEKRRRDRPNGRGRRAPQVQGRRACRPRPRRERQGRSVLGGPEGFSRIPGQARRRRRRARPDAGLPGCGHQRPDRGGPGPGRPQGQGPDRVLQGSVQEGREPESQDRGGLLARQDGRRIPRPVPEASGRGPLAAEHDQAGRRSCGQADRSEVNRALIASPGSIPWGGC